MAYLPKRMIQARYSILHPSDDDPDQGIELRIQKLGAASYSYSVNRHDHVLDTKEQIVCDVFGNRIATFMSPWKSHKHRRHRRLFEPASSGSTWDDHDKLLYLNPDEDLVGNIRLHGGTPGAWRVRSMPDGSFTFDHAWQDARGIQECSFQWSPVIGPAASANKHWECLWYDDETSSGESVARMSAQELTILQVPRETGIFEYHLGHIALTMSAIWLAVHDFNIKLPATSRHMSISRSASIRDGGRSDRDRTMTSKSKPQIPLIEKGPLPGATQSPTWTTFIQSFRCLLPAMVRQRKLHHI